VQKGNIEERPDLLGPKTDVSIRHRGAGPAKKQTSWAKLSVNLTRARDSLISFLVRIKRPRQSSPTDKWGCSVGALPNQEELTTTDERRASDARVVPHVSDSCLVGARVWQGREAWLPVVYGLSLAWQCCNVGDNKTIIACLVYGVMTSGTS
jgi:hypothetical protein